MKEKYTPAMEDIANRWKKNHEAVAKKAAQQKREKVGRAEVLTGSAAVKVARKERKTEDANEARAQAKKAQYRANAKSRYTKRQREMPTVDHYQTNDDGSITTVWGPFIKIMTTRYYFGSPKRKRMHNAYCDWRTGLWYRDENVPGYVSADGYTRTDHRHTFGIMTGETWLTDRFGSQSVESGIKEYRICIRDGYAVHAIDMATGLDDLEGITADDYANQDVLAYFVTITNMAPTHGLKAAAKRAAKAA